MHENNDPSAPPPAVNTTRHGPVSAETPDLDSAGKLRVGPRHHKAAGLRF
jgi:hypothetical protein